MQLIVFERLEGDAGQDGLLPSGLVGRAPISFLGLSQIADAQNLVCVVVEDPDPQTLETLRGTTKRLAIGATEIWRNFPDLRDRFIVEVDRMDRLSGARSTRTTLRDTKPGDVLKSTTVTISEVSLQSGMAEYPALPGIGFIGAKGQESLKLDEASIFAAFPHLRPRSYELPSYEAHTLFVVRKFGLFSSVTQRLSFGNSVVFVPAREILQDRGFAEKLKDSISSWGSDMEFDGIFICDGPNSAADMDLRGFYRALVNRVLSATSIFLGLAPFVYFEIHSSADQRSTTPRWNENWFPVRREAESGVLNVRSYDDPTLTAFRKVIEKMDIRTFQKRNEDYRLRAIDTLAERRATESPPLLFAIFWMAIERLLSFRQETSLNLGICIAALSAPANRPDAVRRVKELYRLRSDIVHGYSFAGSQTFHEELQFLGETLRKLLTISLSFNDGDSLRGHLADITLSGGPAYAVEKSQ